MGCSSWAAGIVINGLAWLWLWRRVFFRPPGEERRRKGREGGRRWEKGKKRQTVSVAAVASKLRWRGGRHFKTQSTFLLSLSGTEAKCSQHSLPPLYILQGSGHKTRIYNHFRLFSVPSVAVTWPRLNVASRRAGAFVAVFDGSSDLWKYAVNNLFTGLIHALVGRSLQGGITRSCSSEPSSTFISGLLMVCMVHRHKNHPSALQ